VIGALSRGVRALTVAASLALAVAGSSSGAVAATLVPGDEPATVTLNGLRPISAPTDHIVAFRRGGTIYVCAGDLTKAVMGAVSHDGQHFTITSFKGMTESRTAAFTLGSEKATLDGKDIELKAPPVKAYGRLYIPLSFFGSPGMRTKFAVAKDGKSGTIILPNE